MSLYGLLLLGPVRLVFSETELHLTT